MDLIILNDGLYQLIPVTKEVMEGIELFTEMSCFDLCDILRLKLTGYVDTLNLHIMNDGSGNFIGCMCRWSSNWTNPLYNWFTAQIFRWSFAKAGSSEVILECSLYLNTWDVSNLFCLWWQERKNKTIKKQLMLLINLILKYSFKDFQRKSISFFYSSKIDIKIYFSN